MAQITKRHDHTKLPFPQGFLWGSATSAFQVEGNNVNSDWWHWEQKHLPPHLRSGLACDHYFRYNEDFQLSKSLGHNSHRLSLEWSRIEPTEGNFDQAEIDHYKRVLKSLKQHGFTVMLTLHHFTSPFWLFEKGGWSNPKAVDYFERFVKRVAPELAPLVDFWITINEPGVYVYEMYVDKVWFVNKSSLYSEVKTYLNFASAHKKAYRVLHSLPNPKPVGIAHNVQSFEPYHNHSLKEHLAVLLSDLFANHSFYFLTKGYHDFLGINYYFNYHIDQKETGFLPEVVNPLEKSREVSDLGWEIYPEGMFNILTDLSDHLPIYITECGIASTNDDRRTRFLINYLLEIFRAIKAGVNVKGFFYWSLLDNYEWHRGFDPKFGLVEVNYKTQDRIIRPSAFVYRDIIKNNGIPHYLLRLLGHSIRAEDVLALNHLEVMNLHQHPAHFK